MFNPAFFLFFFFSPIYMFLFLTISLFVYPEAFFVLPWRATILFLPIPTMKQQSQILHKVVLQNSTFVLVIDGPNYVSVTLLLDGKNFLAWARAIRHALGAKNKFQFVDGSIPVLALLDPNR